MANKINPSIQERYLYSLAKYKDENKAKADSQTQNKSLYLWREKDETFVQREQEALKDEVDKGTEVLIEAKTSRTLSEVASKLKISSEEVYEIIEDNNLQGVCSNKIHANGIEYLEKLLFKMHGMIFEENGETKTNTRAQDIKVLYELNLKHIDRFYAKQTI